jgi:hypothetical protein
MKNFPKENLVGALELRLLDAGLGDLRLLARSREVVVFGSRAVGVNSGNSDLDVIFVTGKDRRRTKTETLDCICIPESEWVSSFWRGSELANHVAAYGVWLVGGDEWRNSVQVSGRAAGRKAYRVARLIANVRHSWCVLHPVFRSKYQLTIRRELQRLGLLRVGIAVPPTPVLDLRWQGHEQAVEELLEIARRFSEDLDFLERLLLRAA